MPRRVLYSNSYSTSPMAISTSPFLCEPAGYRERNVRQAFLRSYTFSVHESYGERLKRGLRELNETGKWLLTEIRDRISDGRYATRAFRALRSRLPPPSKLNPLRCFRTQKKYCLKDLDW